MSACHSEDIGRWLIKAGVSRVVAVRRDFPVLDFAAIQFAPLFYKALFQGNPIEKAFNIAKLGVKGDPRWDKYKVFAQQEARRQGKPFLPEDRKFLLLPDGRKPAKEFSLDHWPENTDPPVFEGPGTEPTNIPVKPPELFTGRGREMHAVINHLLDRRLVTVKGPGGMGKTTLAAEVSRWFHLRNFPEFRDGVFRVELRGIEGCEGVMQRLGVELDISFESEREFYEKLGSKRLLLFLDNVEDVLIGDCKGMRSLLNHTLERAGHVKLLVTSQKEIGGNLYAKEEIYNLPSLDGSSAYDLFTRRMQKDRLEVNGDAMAQLLGILGGHPLSIILIAAQLCQGISVAGLLKRIQEQQAEAVKKITDPDPEHGESLVKSLTAAYEYLPQKAKTLFQVMSYFPAGIEEENLDNIMEEDTEDYRVQLMEVSLLEVMPGNRFILQPAVRLFGEYVLTDEVKDEYGKQILSLWAMMASAVRAKYYLEKENTLLLKAVFLKEDPNWRYAVEKVSPPDGVKNTFSASAVLSETILYLYNHIHIINEGIHWGERILPLFKKNEDKPGQANTLLALGNFYNRKPNLQQAENAYIKALTIFKEIDDTLGIANTWKSLGYLYLRRSNFQLAENAYNKALNMFEEIGDILGQANCFTANARLMVLTSKFTEARAFLDNANKLYLKIDEVDGQVDTFEIRSLLALSQSNTEAAEAAFQQGRELKKQSQNYAEAVSWYLYYARHFESKQQTEHAQLCRRFARILAEDSGSKEVIQLCEKEKMEVEKLGS